MAFNFTKKRPPTDTQIRRHRDQVRLRAQWKDDVGRIQGVSAKLANAYTNHKGDFALGRYEELKQMIKDAIKEYRDAIEKSQKHSREGAASAMASKYSGNANTGSQGNGSTSSAPSDSGAAGLFAKLKKKAVDFASSASTTPSPAPSSPTSKEEQKEREMDTWGYEGRNAKVIEEETETFRKEVLQLKADFRAERDKLERLSKEYEDSKKHAPPQRYTVLKYMIKDHIGA